MTITVPNNLNAGESIEISLSSSSRKNQTVTINIDDGEGNETSVQITLDNNGNGSVNWTVWERDAASFNDDVCTEVSRAINPAPG